MGNIVVAGIGTEVGKTVVSALLTSLLKGDYWKPIQSGNDHSDADAVKRLLEPERCIIHPSAYSFRAPLSPHQAARMEGCRIDPAKIALPMTTNALIIEMAGGVFVPLNEKVLNIDLFEAWNARWVLVSRHYLGSINHTLLTVEALKARHISVAGIVFNGSPNPDSEQAILQFSAIPFLGRVVPEVEINPTVIQRYVKQWRQSGIHSLK